MGKLSKIWSFFQTGVDGFIPDVNDKPEPVSSCHIDRLPPYLPKEEVIEQIQQIQVLPQARIVAVKFKLNALESNRTRYYFRIEVADKKGGWKVLSKSEKTYANLKQVMVAIAPLGNMNLVKNFEVIDE